MNLYEHGGGDNEATIFNCKNKPMHAMFVHTHMCKQSSNFALGWVRKAIVLMLLLTPFTAFIVYVCWSCEVSHFLYC